MANALHTQNEIESDWSEIKSSNGDAANSRCPDSDGSECSCGSGKLGPKQYNDGQFMGGFTVSRKCKECGMLHFFQS